MNTKPSTSSASARQTMELAQRLIVHADNICAPTGGIVLTDDWRWRPDPGLADTRKAAAKDMVAAARLIRRWRVGIQEAIQRTEDGVLRAHLTKLMEG